VARWWSAHQLSQLVIGLRDADGLDPATLADLEARPALSPQARLGLAQVRLRLTLSEQAAQIDESRRRIVARADQESRRLERDLHDGAQQYLLGLGMALLAQPQTPRTAQALKETHACIDDLRMVAREIYPPVLESGGLRPALSALARGRLAALDVPDRRFPAATERTAYLAVADILHRGSQPISVAGQVTGAELVVEVDGPPPPVEALIHDRVAATGGTLHVQDCRTVMRLPCE
jgi:signal transduction histidine kinase